MVCVGFVVPIQEGLEQKLEEMMVSHYHKSHHHHPLATMKEILFHQTPEALEVAAEKQEGLEVLLDDMG